MSLGSPVYSSNSIEIAKREIEVLKILNADKYNKCDNIIDYYSSYEDHDDIWLAFEKGGKSLTSLAFKIKGDFLKSERIYIIKKGLFIKYLVENISEFKKMIKEILIGIDYINSKGIIHSDIKPENILIDYNEEESLEDPKNFKINQVKIIDFGSSFFVSNTGCISSNTPEYLCPELTESLDNNSKDKKAFLDNLKYYPSCIDIWSLGISLLELVLACPVWMNFKAKVYIKGKSFYDTGLFGVKGRDPNKIHQKQLELCDNIHKFLSKSLVSYFTLEQQNLFEDLLKKMLNNNYKLRITPKEALIHPFLTDT